MLSGDSAIKIPGKQVRECAMWEGGCSFIQCGQDSSYHHTI